MEIYIAKNAGFCFGVKAAVSKARETALKYGKASTLGELIHNEQVVELLKSENINVVNTLDEVDNEHLIVRSHGVPKSVYHEANIKNIKLVDATCPYVKKIQNIAEKWYNDNYQVIIVGSSNHPEVIGIRGFTDDTAIVIGDEKDFDEEINDRILNAKGICIVAQTTITGELWKNITEKILILTRLNTEKNDEFEVKLFNTICSATTNNQEAAFLLSQKVDLMIVIGGKNSSNTQKLFNISCENCKNCVYIQSFDDFKLKDIKKYGKIGITAGASTPDWVIDEVVEKLRNEGGVIING